jgi:hypothetical protein
VYPRTRRPASSAAAGSHTFKGDEFDRRFYELCVLSELRNALRSADLAERGELPNASLADGVLKITPLTNAVPLEADAQARAVFFNRLGELRERRREGGADLHALPRLRRTGACRPAGNAHLLHLGQSRSAEAGPLRYRRRGNALVRVYCATNSRLGFIDVYPVLFDREGNPRLDLYLPDKLPFRDLRLRGVHQDYQARDHRGLECVEDGVHLNNRGCQRWNSLVTPVLK